MSLNVLTQKTILAKLPEFLAKELKVDEEKVRQSLQKAVHTWYGGKSMAITPNKPEQTLKEKIEARIAKLQGDDWFFNVSSNANCKKNERNAKNGVVFFDDERIAGVPGEAKFQEALDAFGLVLQPKKQSRVAPPKGCSKGKKVEPKDDEEELSDLEEEEPEEKLKPTKGKATKKPVSKPEPEEEDDDLEDLEEEKPVPKTKPQGRRPSTRSQSKKVEKIVDDLDDELGDE